MIAVSWGNTEAPEKKATTFITLHEIAEQVCKKHKVLLGDFMSKRRHHYITMVRFEAYWRARNETMASLPEIGRAFGNRDHSTIHHGIRRHEERLKAAINPSYPTSPHLVVSCPDTSESAASSSHQQEENHG